MPNPSEGLSAEVRRNEAVVRGEELGQRMREAIRAADQREEEIWTVDGVRKALTDAGIDASGYNINVLSDAPNTDLIRISIYRNSDNALVLEMETEVF
jgi:hypothetical protein